MAALLLVLAFASSALVFGQACALAQAISNLWAGQAVPDQLALLAGFLACFALRHAIAFAQGEALERYSGKQAARLRNELLTVAFCDDAALARHMGTAATAMAATEGVDDIARYVRVIPPKACGVIGTSAPLLAALLAVDWVSGVIALIAAPVIVLFMVMLGRQAQARAERQYAESGRLANRFIDSLRGIESITSLNAGKRAGASVHDASEQLRVATMRTLSVATLSGAVLDLICVFGVAAIAMMLAFRLMDGSIELAAALTALMLAPEFFTPIRLFASDFHASLDGRNALSALLSIVDDARAHARAGAHGQGPEDGRALGGKGGGAAALDGNGAVKPWGASSTLQMSHVSYRYGKAAEALSDVSFSACGYAKVGIVGMSGSGKSTLIDLVAGFKSPSAGAVALDGEPADLGCAAWRDQLHYIPQHPHLFRMSLADNIRFYAPDASLEDVLRAVRLVGLDKLVDELPEGLDTVVGEGARKMSGGEAQRVALARVLLDDRKVLLFDEPTAHLDIETEMELKQRMLACMEGRLVLFATHRLHWMEDMDLVLVMEDGAVVQAGAPAELLACDGAARRLLNAQEGGPHE